MSPPGISAREFARRSGCDAKQVRRALKTGKLQASPDGTLDPAQLETGWRRPYRNSRGAGDKSEISPPIARTKRNVPTRGKAGKVTGKAELRAGWTNVDRVVSRKAMPITINGHAFDSTAAAHRYEELRAALLAGKIEQLRVRPVYALQVDGAPFGDYKADFEYIERETGAKIIEVFDWSGSRARGSTAKAMRAARSDRILARTKLRLVEALTGAKLVTLRPSAPPCGNQMSSEAKACPHCDANPNGRLPVGHSCGEN